MNLRSISAGFLAVTICLIAAPLVADDWPMWCYNASRGACSLDDLPKQLRLQWVRQLPPARPAWPASQAKLRFDVSYEPIVLGQRMFVSSNFSDSVTAYDTRTGRKLWRFYTGGPVRFAPAAQNRRVYAVSDDGYLYCLDAETGQLIWRVNGGPSHRPILGNQRLVSSWPARGGVVLADGIAYFAASIWPSMGVFIHAVDAETGRIVWTNSETGAMYITHPHGADSFGSISPQGYLAISGSHLIVPGGRTLPAVFDRRSGKLEHFNFGGKGDGGYDVMAAGNLLIVRGGMFQLSDGVSVARGSATIADTDWLIGATGQSGPITAVSVSGKIGETTVTDRRGRKTKRRVFTPDQQRQFTPDGPARVFLRAGGTIYAGGSDGSIAGYSLPADIESKQKQKPIWSAKVDGDVWSMLAADERLFVVTRDAKIYCFGSQAVEPKIYAIQTRRANRVADRLVRSNAAVLTRLSGGPEGYALALGLGDLPLIDELLVQTNLHIIAVDADETKVDRFRREMDARGLYGVRVAAHVGDPLRFNFPPYLANLILCDLAAVSGVDAVRALFKPLRPYGGAAGLQMNDQQHAAFVRDVEAARLANAEVQRHGELTLLKRVGALPDAGVWTHQYGDATNSVVSQDKRVKAPLGVLWFGGPSNDRVLPRHGHGPSPQVIGGRLFIEGADMLRCVDVYTGRVWWERDFPGLGKFYDNIRHQPGAGEIGSNYVSREDHVYLVYGEKILELDAKTGETTKDFSLNADGNGNKPVWGFLAVSGELLVATSSPVTLDEDSSRGSRKPTVSQLLKSARYSSASRRLVVFDRHTGRLLWSRNARFSFRHNCICVATGTLFCIDGMSPKKLQMLRRRDIEPSGQTRLLALDVQSGKEIWSTTEDVFGTFLNYSTEHDVLIQAGSAYRDRAKDEVGQGIVAYRGRDGVVLWKNRSLKYGGPCLLWHEKIITNGGGGFELELLTGRQTGWKYQRMYGCNTAVGSEHLLTFRSGAAGFLDLSQNGGTGNLGGFKSSCTSSLIVADGVLNAPDYTRTCSCAYQNQTSLAMIHMPEAELWTYGAYEFTDGRIDRVGLNFGAPGDRRDENKTLWLDYPSVGGPSPVLDVKLTADNPVWFRRHSAYIDGSGPRWVAASGGKGIESVSLKLGDSKIARSYTVRLHFSEPDGLKPGERVFSVSLQGTPVLRNFDIVQEAGGRDRAVVQEFKGISVTDRLDVALNPKAGSSTAAPLLCGIEAIAEP